MSRVLVPLAQGCEELEAITITDLLTRAGIEVVTAGLDTEPVKASRGMTLLPDTTIDAISGDEFDMIVLPGGLPGADHLRENATLQSMLQQQSAANRYVGAICAAPKALEKAGLLDHRTATSFPGVLDSLQNDTISISSAAIELDGNIVTSRGPGTAMDFALKLIELLEGKETMQRVNESLVRD